MSDPSLERADPPAPDLRPPAEVMRLARLGAMFPTRLSFLRVLLRDLAAQGGRPDWTRWDIDSRGHGTAVCSITLDGRVWSLVAYADPLADEARSDRVIATAWDACFTLFDGVPGPDDVAAIGPHARTQEAGRYDRRVHVLSRANKSVRLFGHVVDALAAGVQPDPAKLEAIGYLMRTTAVYGNGKFGMADREPGTLPFRLEMLTVALIREFTLRLAEHVARARNPAAAPLCDESVRRLGIGNATGLGMAPFLISHPELLNNWMLARETAVARVRAVRTPDTGTRRTLRALATRVASHLEGWHVDDGLEETRIRALASRFAALRADLRSVLRQPYPFDALLRRAHGDPDLEELLIALLLEPHGDLIDALCHCMDAGPPPPLDARMPLARFRRMVECDYGWIDGVPTAGAPAMAWYVSQDKLEPRFGSVTPAMAPHRRLPIDIARKVAALRADLEGAPDGPLAAFLLAHPDHRWIVRRAQSVARHPYGEVRDDLVGETLRPVDLLRAKLALFGATRFDPRSDRWLRITLYQGAPRLSDLTPDNADDAFLPAFR